MGFATDNYCVDILVIDNHIQSIEAMSQTSFSMTINQKSSNEEPTYTLKCTVNITILIKLTTHRINIDYKLNKEPEKS